MEEKPETTKATGDSDWAFILALVVARFMCLRIKGQFPEIRGSGFTMTGCVSVWPSTVSRTVY